MWSVWKGHPVFYNDIHTFVIGKKPGIFEIILEEWDTTISGESTVCLYDRNSSLAMASGIKWVVHFFLFVLFLFRIIKFWITLYNVIKFPLYSLLFTEIELYKCRRYNEITCDSLHKILLLNAHIITQNMSLIFYCDTKFEWTREGCTVCCTRIR